MKNTFIIPLVLLASISTLTSCSQGTQKIDTIPPLVNTDSTGEVSPIIPTVIDTMTGIVSKEPNPVPPVITESNTGTQESGVTQAPVVESTPGVVAPITRTRVETYQSPGGLDEIEFSVTIDTGVITAASAKVMAANDASKYNQGNFAKQVSAKVVGMAKKNFKLDTVGGASLTTAAFEKFVQSL